jgi:hypothetical protein
MHRRGGSLPGPRLQLAQGGLHSGAQAAAARSVQELRGQQLVDGLPGAHMQHVRRRRTPSCTAFGSR